MYCLWGSLNTSRSANRGAAIKQCVSNDLLGELQKSEKTRFSATLSFTNLCEIALNSRKPKRLSCVISLFEVMCLYIVYRNSQILRIKIHIFSR